ncbi:MAG: hypothetical protein SF052_10570 [Bacteroidia bacterium]|nr:hypothetical protein [Bacteroidia bacterium]
MRKPILGILMFFFSLPAFSQPVLKGVMLRNVGAYLNKGDTVTIRALQKLPINLSGVMVPGDTLHYYIKDQSGGPATSLPKNVKLLPDNLNYWERVWLLLSSESVIQSGWRRASRDTLEYNARQQLGLLEEQNLLFHDPFLDDYFRRKLAEIHPGPMIKGPGIERHFQLKITLLGYPRPIVYEDGTILADLSWLTGFFTEETFMQALAEVICHSIGDHYVKFNFYSFSDYDFTPDPGEKRYALYFARKFMTTLPPDSSRNDTLVFTRSIAPAITRAAWKHRELREYRAAEQLIDRLIEADIATDETYLLKAMLLRTNPDSKAGNLAALTFLQKAERAAIHLPIPLEIPRERALILMELGRYNEALETFEEYLEALLTGEGSYEDIRWARDMIFRCENQVVRRPSTSQ